MRILGLILLGIVLLSGTAAAAGPEERAYLGVSVREVRQPEDGVVVLSVVPGSPAQTAGLRAGDRIVASLEGRPCDLECFGNRIREAGPGARIVIRFVRDGATREAQAVLGRAAAVRWDRPERIEAPELLLRNRLDAILAEVPRPPAPPELLLSPASRVGLDLIQATPELRQHLGGPAGSGALVGQVKPGSAADRAGILTGDLLTAVEGRPVRGDDGWIVLMNSLDSPSCRVDLIRDGRPRTVTMELPVQPLSRPLAPSWPVWGREQSQALEDAMQSLESSLESEDMSRELRDHLQAVREQLRRALNPPPKQAPAGR